jgi:hypothetical protein
MGLLDHLTEEIFTKTDLLTEGQLSDEPPKKFSRAIATLAGKDEFLFTLYSEHTLWQEKPGLETVGVRPYGDGQHIVFVYDPSFIEEISTASVYFLLGHEIYHILRDHHDRSNEKSKQDDKSVKHKLANICMDTWINSDLKAEGTLAGFPMEPPFEGYAFREEGNWGDVEKWVNTICSKASQKDVDEKYDGPRMWEPLYDWVSEMFDKYDAWPKKEDDGEPQENYPKIGDIIRGPDGQYGEVVKIDEENKKVTAIEPITKEEAHKRVKERA